MFRPQCIIGTQISGTRESGGIPLFLQRSRLRDSNKDGVAGLEPGSYKPSLNLWATNVHAERMRDGQTFTLCLRCRISVSR